MNGTDSFVQCHSGSTHSAALVESTRQDMGFVLLTGWGHTTAHTPCPLLKNKPEVQCEEPQGGKQIRNGGEVSRRNLREHIGSTRHYSAIPAPASPQSHSHTTGWLQESLSSRTREKCWPQCCMHLIQVGFGVVPSWFHSSPATRPGLFWWTKAKNTRSSTVNSLGELQLARS